MSLPDKICMLPWTSVEASPTGTVRPCCLAQEEISKSDGNKYSLKQNTLEEAFQSGYMQDLRKDFLAGNKPETCKSCWKEEAAGRTSKRMNSRVRLKEHYNKIDFHDTDPKHPWFLDLKLGNICNLKCRICGSWSSSKWAKEEVAYVDKIWKDDPNYNRKEHLAFTYLKDGAWPRENNDFWDNLKTLLPNIKYFEFTGGEPFLIKQHFDLLEYAVEQGHSENIEIHYNTNGTVFPEKVELWNRFRTVEIALSIDNTDDRFEYERYGAKWQEVQGNITKFAELANNNKKIQLQLCWTANVQNVYYLPEICDWISTQNFNQTHFNMLHDPWHMSISRMTETAQDLVIDRLTQHQFTPKFKAEILRIVQVIRNGEGSDGTEFLQKMQQTDQYRDQSLHTTHKEIAKAMGYE